MTTNDDLVMVLFINANAALGRFSIVDSEGAVVLRGYLRRFVHPHPDEIFFDVSVAKEAITLAWKKKKKIKAKQMRLTLNTDAALLLSTRYQASLRGGPARILQKVSQMHGITLEVKHISALSNPAHRRTLYDDEKARHANDLSKLLAGKII